ncbi:MAG: N-acetyl-gamma-glutamyl-phosphate reductase [bacterium]|nr:N-acetyl-gamma-glutamyl-phosphate reductase [Acidimicrobiia bacterium]MCY4650194.1 N-acetyl-gamma-glutamyl-phosphate reductase [bacterium]
MKRRAAVIGASGYAGGELVRLLDAHPVFDLVWLGAHSRAGARLGEVHPHLSGGDRRLAQTTPEDIPPVDAVFLALPHGASYQLGHELADRGAAVFDLGSDYRFDTPQRYEKAYGSPHPAADRLGEWSYGLPELFDLKGARRVALPGCYPTAVLLAAVPLLAAGLATGPVVADCLSGVSGAGRSLRPELLFGQVAEGARAYGIATHRHRPEIEMGMEKAGVSVQVTFTPHLLPIQRGLLATVTMPAAGALVDRTDLLGVLDKAYQGRSLVEVVEVPPQTRWVAGSSRAIVTAFFDSHTGMVIAQGALDNLLKGAASQAVQAANLVFGLEEELGLDRTGWMP